MKIKLSNNVNTQDKFLENEKAQISKLVNVTCQDFFRFPYLFLIQMMDF